MGHERHRDVLCIASILREAHAGAPLHRRPDAAIAASLVKAKRR